MNDFISINKGEKNEGDIENSAFFPAISLSEMRLNQNVDNTITTPRLKQALITAMVRTNNELKGWQIEQESKGFTHIADVNEDKINHENVLITTYKYAIFTLAHAYIIEKYRDFDATEKGIKKSESVMQTACDLYRESRYAIRDILDLSHSTFELI